jgi:hypothetical protein
MSLENCGVFQPLKEVTFRGILVFSTAPGKCDLWYQSRKICEGRKYGKDLAILYPASAWLHPNS